MADSQQNPLLRGREPQWLQNADMRSCFDGLPPFVQENIMQSSRSFFSVEELQRCAQNLQQGS